MAVTPINIARVSQNLRAFNLLATVRGSHLGLFRVQNQLASGLKFLSPGENPAGAAQVLALEQTGERLAQIRANLRDANATLSAGESGMQDAINLLTQVGAIASENVNDTVDRDARAAAAALVNGLLDQLVAIGNRKHLSTYLFAGHLSGTQPFEVTGDGVIYRGDEGQSRTIVATDFSQEAFTVAGQEFFGATSAQVQGFVDLDPALTLDTRIRDLRGTTGEGVRLGQIRVTVGSQQVEIDLSGADTVGDLVDRLNAEMPPALAADIDEVGLIIKPSGVAGNVPFTIEDVGGGQTARDLGIHLPNPGIAAGSADLDPVLTLRTRLSDLNLGTGVNLSGGVTIRNGDRVATVDFAGLTTLEDVINRINQTSVGVRASIAPDGRSLLVVNVISGTSMSIEENGGVAATSLGIRSIHAGTLLADLNDGRGVTTVAGDDIRVTTRNGSVVDVDIDGALTVQDVLDLFNAAGGGTITAALAATGNGIVITDHTSGSSPLSIQRINNSPALDGLGLNVSATGNQLIGDDPNPQRVDSAFTAMIELRDALAANDNRAITAAAERLDAVLLRMQEVQGRMASVARAMEERELRIEDTLTASQVLMSDVRDVDMTEAVVRFQQLQTALQANLLTSQRVLNMSLLDHLT